MISNSYLTREQEDMRLEIKAVAEDCGLDFFKTNFMILEFDQFNKVVANGGFPKRYNHWQFGMEYERYSKQLGHGFGRIYELVINNDPAIGYLVDTIVKVHQRMVMAHVYGHVDFFKNNYMFKETNKNMVNKMANHAEIIKKHIEKHGETVVEKFLDACLSLDDLIDAESVRIKRREDPINDEDDCEEEGNCATCQGCSSGGCSNSSNQNFTEKEYRIKTKHPYMEDFINTPEFLDIQKKQDQIEKKKKKMDPPSPERDVLLYILENSEKLKKWQKEILSIIRDEAYYFYPQGATKIMNEGWASYWHHHMMAERGLAGPEGIVEYAIANAQVLSTGKTRINPYQIGFSLFEDIRERWDRGKYGPEYEHEKNFQRRKNWDTQEGKGLDKIFEVRKTRNDIEFIREFMTDDFIREKMLYTYKLDPNDDWYKIANKNPEHIRKQFLNQLTNFGQPIIRVHNGNFRNAKELMLEHVFDGRSLDIGKTRKTLENVYKLWGRPIYLASRKEDGTPAFYSFDGQEHKMIKPKK